jgi:hypothetical protein
MLFSVPKISNLVLIKTIKTRFQYSLDKVIKKKICSPSHVCPLPLLADSTICDTINSVIYLVLI